MQKIVRITGERGRWLASAEGRLLPVIHDTWRRWPTGYFDPMLGAKLDGQRYVEFIEALQSEDLLILQKDKPGSFERAGYIGIFTFKDLVVGDDGSVSLTLVDRYANPAN